MKKLPVLLVTPFLLIATSVFADGSAEQSLSSEIKLENSPSFSYQVTNNGEATKLFPSSEGVNYPGLPSNFTSDKGSGKMFTSMLVLMKYRIDKKTGTAVFRRSELEKVKRFFGNPEVESGFYQSYPKTDTITVSFNPLWVEDGKVKSAKQEGLKDIGFIVASADDNDQTSLNVLASMLLDAMNNGATNADVTGEGITDILWADSLGIGMMSVGATTNNQTNSATGGVGSAGTGYTSAKSGHDKLPYLQMIPLHK